MALAAAAGAFALAFTDAALAHAVGERYDLPVPLGYYLTGAALAVILTFVAAALMPARRLLGRRSTGERAPTTAWPIPRVVVTVARAVAIFLLLLTVAAGLWGDPHPARNFAPTFVWIIWWIGFALVAALVGDPWPLANPWRALFDAVAPRRGRPRWTYPERLAAWPAVALLLALAWLEVISPFAADPRALAVVITVYSIVTWIGMTRFGADIWLRRVDPVALAFATLGRFAPLAITRDGADGRITAAPRPPGAGLLDDDGIDRSLIAFVMAMLSTVLFDGFLGTALWRNWDRFVGGLLPRGFDRESYVAATAALLGLWLLFLAAYHATAWLTRRLDPIGNPGRAFCLTLVPIAVGYNVAHNFTYLAVQSQEIAVLATDPFGRGWNLLGTAGFKADIGLIDPAVTWTVAVVAIVAGHVVAVVLAHLVALRLYGEARRAVRALVPMTVLMVLYTVASLGILAEPITRYRTPDPGYSMRIAPLAPVDPRG